MKNKITGENLVESEVRAKVYDLLGAWQSGYAARALSGGLPEKFKITDNTVLKGEYVNGCLGMDELDFVELIMELEEYFWVVVTESDAEEVKTVGDLIKVLAGTP